MDTAAVPKRVAATAGLLNLSGLGAGYLYLRRWRWFLAHVILLGAWAWLASSTTPWLALLAALWVGSVAAACILGRRRQPLLRSSWLPAGAGVLLTGVVVVLVSQYRSEAREQFEAGNEAHLDGDCEAAVRHYDRVTGIYSRSFTTAVDRAPGRRDACRGLLAARQQADDRDFPAAIAAYQDYVGHDAALFPEGAETELASTRAAYAERIVADGAEDGAGDLSRYTEAYEQYVLLVEEQPGSPEAQDAPQAVEAMLDDATADLGADGACDEVEVLEFFAEQFPGDDGLSDDLVDDAEDALPDAEEACEEQRIEEEIAVLADDADELLPPDSVGSVAGTSVALEIVNDSDQPLEVLFTGPETGRLVVEPCSGCGTADPPAGPGSDTSSTTACGSATSPRRTVTLPAGSYELAVRTTGDEVVTPLLGTWDLQEGTEYSACYLVRPTSSFDAPSFDTDGPTESGSESRSESGSPESVFG